MNQIVMHRDSRACKSFNGYMNGFGSSTCLDGVNQLKNNIQFSDCQLMKCFMMFQANLTINQKSEFDVC